MKKKDTKKKTLPIESAFRVLSFIFAAILISACSKDIVFPNSEVVPAAEAVLKIDENSSNNYEVKLVVENLAAPERLTPSRRNYVVWMVTKKHGTINIGNLKVNRKNKAELETMTPYEPIRVFITAEDGDEVVLPSTQVVLDSGKFKK
ncbi:hypothetical protein SAMN04488034_10311 [Salinimicrobium catena]|uniref:Uncharacterized protein n=1 Tax=Salinimicrobium catena TaxID=390640 RepID=A0A1H5MNM2_9FLAO|nr:hypothetical protein [Salinimicrobium catena]SDL26824.1 hypothetical protein SAMN04488140_10311 [Salinimicrobium catena]SEE90949.1 hypothetical protein SAMN04488034_10311 [Salinimicrobium catena]